MSGTKVQYQLAKAGGEFSKISVPIPAPSAYDVIVRPKVVALNPIDWKKRYLGIRVFSWPTILGSEFSGIVETVGESVTEFKPGDEVFSMSGNGMDGWGFQELVTVQSANLGMKPASVSFEEAASLPAGYLTAAATIAIGLGVSLPLWLGLDSPKSLKSVLVLGGSSAVGSATIQLLRQSLPSAIILTTSSSTHHAHLKSLGASECFERAAQGDPAKIVSAAAGGYGVDAIIDSVGAAALQPEVFDALSPHGLRLYAEVATGAETKIPQGVKHKLIIMHELLRLPGGDKVMKALSNALERGEYKVPTLIDVVGKGFDAVEGGLERLRKGVSGTKLVIRF